MVRAVRRGASPRHVATQFRVALSTVQYWVDRATGQRLDRVDWTNHPRGPRHPANRTPAVLEDLVLTLRHALRTTSDLGEHGAVAIHQAVRSQGVPDPPTVRTIGRILERRGVLDGQHRVRHRPPPRGWYLPEVAEGRAELDQFDGVSGLVIQGGPEVEVLTGISLHGGLPAAWPSPAITAELVRTALLEHWRAVGVPAYAQFDNDTRFQGPHQHPDVMGSVMRLCLSLEVIPVFAPVQELGFQAAMESFNGRWQAKVWARFQHAALPALQAQSAKYVTAVRQRGGVRIETAPARRPFPAQGHWQRHARPHGRIIFLRRTNAQGGAALLGHTFRVDPRWASRLVRAEVDLDAGLLRFDALRRRDPATHPRLCEVPYVLPRRRSEEDGEDSTAR